jgi:hypothetical protein
MSLGGNIFAMFFTFRGDFLQRPPRQADIAF